MPARGVSIRAEDLIPGLRLPVHHDRYGSQPSVPSVVDVDALLASVRNDCRTGWQSRISKIGESGRWPLFASMHVYWEVYQGLPKLAAGTGLTASELRARYEADYLPHITWVRVAGGYGHDPRVAQITDLTDVLTGHRSPNLQRVRGAAVAVRRRRRWTARQRASSRDRSRPRRAASRAACALADVWPSHARTHVREGQRGVCVSRSMW